MSSLVWFITGSSNGLGLLLSLRVLKAGHRVIATVRDTKRSADAVRSIEEAGGNVLVLDTTESKESITKKVQEADETFGPIDFFVNNAGYSALGPLELFSEKEVERQFQTNVFGPLYAIQAILPSFRQRRSGTIVNLSSVAGHDARESVGLYSASKFALEGLTEALAKEVKEFGISVVLVEPGAFRTNFLNASHVNDPLADGPYKGTSAAKMVSMFDQVSGKQAGDPDKAADVIFEVVSGEGKAGHLKGKSLRLALGKDAYVRIEAKMESVKGDLDVNREVGLSTGFEGA